MGKWSGFAIWDSGTPRVAQLAGKFGQQTRMVITTDFQRKVSDRPIFVPACNHVSTQGREEEVPIWQQQS